MLRLTRLRIDRFRNVRPGTELTFGPTFNVLLGKNATGKSTLLDLVAAITGSDLSRYEREKPGLDLTFDLEIDERPDHETVFQLKVRVVREPKAETSGFPEHVAREPEFDETMEIDVLDGSKAGRLVVGGMHARWEGHGGTSIEFDLRTRVFADWGVPLALFVGYGALRQAAAQQHSASWSDEVLLTASNALLVAHGPGRFDEALGAFTSITDAEFEERLPDAGRSVSGASGLWIPYPVTHISRNGSFRISDVSRGHLSQVARLLGFSGAEAHARVLTKSRDGDETVTSFRGIDFLFFRGDESVVSHDLLSFGQKRLFAFFWYLDLGEYGPVVADELMNGLHHEWIEAAMDRIRGRQSFLATQHPLLLDHVPIASASDVRHTFVRCTTEEREGGGVELAWRNFNEEEADRLFTAYGTGIQHVSEILRTEGLW